MIAKSSFYTALHYKIALSTNEMCVSVCVVYVWVGLGEGGGGLLVMTPE